MSDNIYVKKYLEKRNPKPCACAGPNPPYFWVGNKYLFQNKLSEGLERAFLDGPLFDILDGYTKESATIKIYKNKQEAEAALQRAIENVDEKRIQRLVEWMEKFPDVVD